MIKKDKSIIDIEIYGTVINRNGKPQIMGSILDITERKRNENFLMDLAFKDPLTGLPNRRAIEENLNRSILKTVNKNIAAIMFMDLDGFKSVNDSLGHAIGDVLLVEVTNRLLSSIRLNDSVSRIGGDEFIVLLPNTDKNAVIKVAERIIQDMNQPFVLNNQQVLISASIGIAFYSDEEIGIESFIRKADIAMYQAKKNGKNTYFIYNENKLELGNRRVRKPDSEAETGS